MAGAFASVLLLLLNIFLWIIIIQAVLSWLIVFEVVNIRNPRAANLVMLLERITTPFYKPLRKYIPPIAGIDISPLIVIFGIYILQSLVISIFSY